jgi:hypothetical protein
MDNESEDAFIRRVESIAKEMSPFGLLTFHLPMTST